jgi:hypothetical protein
MNCLQKKIVHLSKEITMAQMKKPVVKVTKAPVTTKPKTPKMTPQDAAMKKLLEKKYGKIYG